MSCDPERLKKFVGVAVDRVGVLSASAVRLRVDQEDDLIEVRLNIQDAITALKLALEAVPIR